MDIVTGGISHGQIKINDYGKDYIQQTNSFQGIQGDGICSVDIRTIGSEGLQRYGFAARINTYPSTERDVRYLILSVVLH
jgi:hypothetical protein